MRKEFVRKILVFEDYFKDFRKTLDRDTLKKVYQVLTLIMRVEVVPSKYLKPIVGKKGLWEIRIEHESNIYRVFCCFDEGNLVILFNGFQKKTQRTPREVLDRAEAIMKNYFNQKKKHGNG